MQELVVFAVRAAVLLVLWGFVIAAVLVVRTDVFGARQRPVRAGVAPSGKGRAPATETGPRRRRRDARTLVVTEGPLVDTTITLSESPITIGRAPDCTLVVGSDDYVSSHHARLVPSGKGWVLEDLDSTNGTYLDGERVTRSTRVSVGTPIRVGQTVLELRR